MLCYNILHYTNIIVLADYPRRHGWLSCHSADSIMMYLIIMFIIIIIIIIISSSLVITMSSLLLLLFILWRQVRPRVRRAPGAVRLRRDTAIYIYIYICIHIYIYICIHMILCISLYIYVYIHTHTERERERERESRYVYSEVMWHTKCVHDVMICYICERHAMPRHAILSQSHPIPSYAILMLSLSSIPFPYPNVHNFIPSSFSLA